LTSQKLSFTVDRFDIIEENPNSQFATAKVQAFASDMNKHNMVCSEDVLQRTASSIYNKPILYNINKTFGDFGTHAEPEDSLIAGFCEPDSATFERLPDNRLGLNVLVRLWKRYAPKFFDIIRNEPFKKVSVEMDLLDGEEKTDGLVEMKNFEYTGICILGDLVQEASPGANLQMVSFAKDRKDYEEAYKKEFSTKYDDVDFEIPESVKKNAQKGLDLYKQYNRGASSVALASARFMLKNNYITKERVRQVAKYFEKHKNDDFDKQTPNDAFISWCLWGGSACMGWAVELSKQLEDIDSKHISYFGGEVILPENKKENKEDMSMDDELEKKDGIVVAEMAVEDKEKEEAPEEEKAEVPAEEKKEEEEGTEEKMSLDANLDVAAMLAMLSDETEGYKELVMEFEKPADQMNYSMIMNAMYGKMCKMTEMCNRMAAIEEENKAYMAENEELKKFKADVEMGQFTFAVDQTLKEIADKVEIPTDNLNALREESKKFDLSTLDAWSNIAKAEAFGFALKENKKDEDAGKIGLPWGIKTSEKKSLWA